MRAGVFIPSKETIKRYEKDLADVDNRFRSGWLKIVADFGDDYVAVFDNKSKKYYKYNFYNFYISGDGKEKFDDFFEKDENGIILKK